MAPWVPLALPSGESSGFSSQGTPKRLRQRQPKDILKEKKRYTGSWRPSSARTVEDVRFGGISRPDGKALDSPRKYRRRDFPHQQLCSACGGLLGEDRRVLRTLEMRVLKLRTGNVPAGEVSCWNDWVPARQILCTGREIEGSQRVMSSETFGTGQWQKRDCRTRKPTARHKLWLC